MHARGLKIDPMHHDRGVYDAGWRERHGHATPVPPSEGHTTTDAAGHKWVELRPANSVRLRFYWGLFAGSVLLFFTLLAGWGQFAKASRPQSALGVTLFVSCVVLSLASLGVAAHAWFIRRNLDDARVFLDRQTLVRGHSFHARVEQRTQRGLKIHEMRVGLICHETVKAAPAGGADRHGSRTISLMEKWETCTRDKAAPGRQKMIATRTFDIPKEKPASSQPGQKELPLIRWKLRVVTVPEEGPAYCADFPVFVHASTPQAFWSEVSSKDFTPSKIERLEH